MYSVAEQFEESRTKLLIFNEHTMYVSANIECGATGISCYWQTTLPLTSRR